MLVLTGSLVKITPGQDVAHLKAHVVVGLAGQLFEVLVPEEAVYVHHSRYAGI